jgi:hypothetical protein
MNPLSFLPGVGPFLGAAWTFIASPAGRLAIVGAVAFGSGYALKARMDRSSMLQAVIAKQRIDLRAATETAAQVAATAASLSETDAKNQETIRELQERIDTLPKVGACALDDAAARGLRRLR